MLTERAQRNRALRTTSFFWHLETSAKTAWLATKGTTWKTTRCTSHAVLGVSSASLSTSASQPTKTRHAQAWSRTQTTLPVACTRNSTLEASTTRRIQTWTFWRVTQQILKQILKNTKTSTKKNMDVILMKQNIKIWVVCLSWITSATAEAKKIASYLCSIMMSLPSLQVMIQNSQRKSLSTRKLDGHFGGSPKPQERK